MPLVHLPPVHMKWPYVRLLGQLQHPTLMFSFSLYIPVDRCFISRFETYKRWNNRKICMMVIHHSAVKRWFAESIRQFLIFSSVLLCWNRKGIMFPLISSKNLCQRVRVGTRPYRRTLCWRTPVSLSDVMYIEVDVWSKEWARVAYGNLNAATGKVFWNFHK